MAILSNVRGVFLLFSPVFAFSMDSVPEKKNLVRESKGSSLVIVVDGDRGTTLIIEGSAILHVKDRITEVSIKETKDRKHLLYRHE